MAVDFGHSNSNNDHLPRFTIEIPTQKSHMRCLNGIDKLHSFFLCIIRWLSVNRSKPHFFKFSSLNRKYDYHFYVSEHTNGLAVSLKYEFRAVTEIQNKEIECIEERWRGQEIEEKTQTNINNFAAECKLNWIYAWN